MKEKIFNALKQAYPQLGLGDELLAAFAASLDVAGIVTDDNLNAVVGAQKSSLEAIQKANDKRATDAAKKAAEEAEKKQAQAIAALKAEEAKKQAKAEPQAAPTPAPQAEPQAAPEGMPEWFKAYQAAQDAKYSEEQAKVEELRKQLATMEEANAKYQAEQEAAKRSSFIVSEAKRLGVPQWRADEGFSIPGDADEKAITEYLSKVANNVKTNILPEGNGSGFPKFDGKVEKSQVESLAEKLLK